MKKRPHPRCRIKVFLFSVVIIIAFYSISLIQFFHFTSINKITSKTQDIPRKTCIERDPSSLYLLKTFGFDPEKHTKDTEFVLVLGSSGLIGSHLVDELKAQNYNVLEVKSRHHLDLRLAASMHVFDPLNIKFVFFLSYEVGGAKFLQLPSLQDSILHSNIKMMDAVFDYLQQRKIKFIFASSSLSADNSTYGYVKRLGENRTRSIGLGRVARFWNVYGFEIPGPKSHILPDIAFKCLMTGHAELLTKGEELRQFMHANDISYNLIQVMEHFEESPFYVDISDGNWITVLSAAQAVGVATNCSVTAGSKEAKKQKRHQPLLNTTWHQKYFKQQHALDKGAEMIAKTMKEFIEMSELKPAVSIIFTKTPVQGMVDKMRSDLKALQPMTVQILSMGDVRGAEGCSDLEDCFGKASSEVLLINDGETEVDPQHLMFYHHWLVQDDTLYFARKDLVQNFDLTRNSTLPGFAHFAMHKECKDINNVPYDYSFVCASRKTFEEIGIPDEKVSPHDWFMKLKRGYISIQFEAPAWSWGNTKKIELDEDFCCRPPGI